MFGPYDFESVMHYHPGNFSIGLGYDSLDPLPQYWHFYHKMGNLALSIGDRAAIGPFQFGNGGFLFNLTVQTNFSHRVQTATNLATPVVWSDLTNSPPQIRRGRSRTTPPPTAPAFTGLPRLEGTRHGLHTLQ